MNRIVRCGFASGAAGCCAWSIVCALGTGCIALKDPDGVLESDAGPIAISVAPSPKTPSDAGSNESRDAGSAALSPLTIQPDHLALWLTADQGLVCTDGRVTQWEDQSPRGTPALPMYGQLGPQCGLLSHAHDRVLLPYFSAPKTSNPLDETLDVDLNCLVHVQYTLFVVERRWADYHDHSPAAEYLLGTTVEGIADAGCATGAFQFGYAYKLGGPELVLDQDCKQAAHTVGRVPDAGPAALSEESAEYSTTWGRALWIPGAPPAYVNDQTQIMAAYGGAIGRGIVANSKLDTRFRGDIAEIVIYDTALDSEDKTKVEQYLGIHWHSMW